MAKLTTKERKKIPAGSFALPGRRYPIEDKAHARNALARVAQHGTPAEKAKVRAAVDRKFPAIGKDKGHKAGHHGRAGEHPGGSKVDGHHGVGEHGHGRGHVKEGKKNKGFWG